MLKPKIPIIEEVNEKEYDYQKIRLESNITADSYFGDMNLAHALQEHK